MAPFTWAKTGLLRFDLAQNIIPIFAIYESSDRAFQDKISYNTSRHAMDKRVAFGLRSI